MLAALATSCAALLTLLCSQHSARLAPSGEAADCAILRTGAAMLALLVF